MYERILIPTDGSACSEAAVRHGLELAEAVGAGVTFLYALEDPLTALSYAPYTPAMASYQSELVEDLRAAAREALDRAMALAEEAGVRAASLLVEKKHPVQAIHEAEAEHDLVVMGTHGRRGFNRWMFGSVAEGALRRSERPYLMVRSGEDAEA